MRIVIIDFELSTYEPRWATEGEAYALNIYAKHGLAESGSMEEHTVKVTGELSDEAFEAFANDIGLGDETAEPNMGALTGYGHVTGDSYGMDGMGWNVGGVTPFAYVTVFVSDPICECPDGHILDGAPCDPHAATQSAWDTAEISA